MARYLIPKPIQRQYEVFPGWGFTQIGIVVAGLVLGAGFVAGLTLIHLGWAIRLVVGVFFVGVAGFLAFPPPHEAPLYTRLTSAWRFYHAPRRYLYDWNAPDWPD